MPSRPLLAPLLPIAAVALMAAGAGDNLPSNAVNEYKQPASRSIAIANRSNDTITSAQVHTNDGKVWQLAHGSIASNKGGEVVTPARNCITQIDVAFKGGRKLAKNGLHACHETQIIVRDDDVSVPQLAVPGGQQHGTPG